MGYKKKKKEKKYEHVIPKSPNVFKEKLKK